MKKWFLLTVLLGAVSLSAVAQDDDMYFVPSKKNVARDRASFGIPRDTYYSGSARSVDEYNRWSMGASHYEVLPVDTGDIISFIGVEGVYPDSLGDFQITQRLQRWDGYEPAYWEGYSDGLRNSSWHSPWYYSYYPWYDSYWYDPWYWNYGYYGWYSPYYYWGWGGYYYPYYYSYYSPLYYGGGGAPRAVNTENHGRMIGSANSGLGSGRTHTYSAGTFGSSRTVGNFGGARGGTTSRSTGSTVNRGGVYSNSNGNFGGARSSSSTSSTATRTRSTISNNSSTSSYSGGNFGGSSGGSFSSGSSGSAGGGGGGGGSFGGGGGGGGSRSGGGSFGGGRR